jgi:hypothetical protein
MIIRIVRFLMMKQMIKKITRVIRPANGGIMKLYNAPNSKVDISTVTAIKNDIRIEESKIPAGLKSREVFFSIIVFFKWLLLSDQI